MNKNTSSGSFDIILSMEYISGRENICLSFGSGLFRKLGWSSGDWLEFDTSEQGRISLHKVAEPSETAFNTRKIKLQSGFYKVCFYSGMYIVPDPVELSKDTASFNAESWTLSLQIPEDYWVSEQEQAMPPMRELTVDDIAAAFGKL